MRILFKGKQYKQSKSYTTLRRHPIYAGAEQERKKEKNKNKNKKSKGKENMTISQDSATKAGIQNKSVIEWLTL